MGLGNVIDLENQRYGDVITRNGTQWDVIHIPTTPKFFYHTGGAYSIPVWRTIVLADIGSVFAAPALTLGTANADGVAATAVRTDATILAFDATAPTTSAVGDAAAVGTATTAARRNHVHGREAFATNAVVLGSAAAAGSAATLMRSDSTIAAFDTTAPVTQALGDSAAVGTAAFAARRDHKHGMPSAVATSALTFSGARVRRTTTQSANNITNTAVSWTGTDGYDTDSYFAAGNPTRLTIPADGYYRITFNLSWAVNGTGSRDAFFRLNGVATHLADDLRQTVTAAFTTTVQQVTYTDHFAAADYLECFGFQSSGGALNIEITLSGTSAWIERLGV